MNPENGYRKDNHCPYCSYFCDAATMVDDKNAVPKPGDLSFCLMCCQPGQFGDDMILKRFDLETVTNEEEKKRLYDMQAKMTLFWASHYHNRQDLKRREEFLQKWKDSEK